MRKNAFRSMLVLLAALLMTGALALAQQPTDNDHDQDQSQAQSSSNSKLSPQDGKFMEKAAEDNLAEIQMAKTAQQKASNNDVKQLAQQLEQDHQKAEDQLQQVSQKVGVTLPSQPSVKDQAMLKKLDGMSGSQFDKAFMKHQVIDHKKDVAKFEQKANAIQNPDLKTWAQNTLPVLKQHLQMAEQDAGKVGVDVNQANQQAQMQEQQEKQK